MIVAEQKPLSEIKYLISPYKQILVLGCGTCMTVCGAGGEREVSFLSQALQLEQSMNSVSWQGFQEYTVKRQCSNEFLDVISDIVTTIDCILSVGCGAGVQTLARRFPDMPVLPGVNTSLLGMEQQPGIWDECCVACGECRLGDTAGICAYTRCAKGILNGPCAGNKNGKCEVNHDIDCAWVMIYKRLDRLGQLDKMRHYYSMRNFKVTPRQIGLIQKPDLAGESDG